MLAVEIKDLSFVIMSASQMEGAVQSTLDHFDPAQSLAVAFPKVLADVVQAFHPSVETPVILTVKTAHREIKCPMLEDHHKVLGMKNNHWEIKDHKTLRSAVQQFKSVLTQTQAFLSTKISTTSMMMLMESLSGSHLHQYLQFGSSPPTNLGLLVQKI